MTQEPKNDELTKPGGFPLWANASHSRRNRLVEFRAGKMYMVENMVHPDPRKGLVYLFQDDHGIVHFCWMDRTMGSVEDDYRTEPMDCTYKRVEKCTTGRVYVLKMKKTKRTRFFWMQEPSTEKDSFYATQVGNLLNFPPAIILFPDNALVGEGSLVALRHLLTRISNQQRSNTGQNDDIIWIDVRSQQTESRFIESRPNILEPSTSAQGAQEQNRNVQQTRPFVNLMEVINQESVQTLKMPKYKSHIENKLPPVTNDPNNLERTLKSSPFRESFENFSVALTQGKMGNVVKDCGVNREAVAAAEKGDVDGFIKALQTPLSSIKPNEAKKNDKPPGSSSDGTKKNQQSFQDGKSDNEGSSRPEKLADETSRKGGSSSSDGGKQKKEQLQQGNSDEKLLLPKQESQQQTEPVRIRSVKLPANKKIMMTKSERQESSSGPTGSPNRDRSQNTDPVQIKEKPKSSDSQQSGPDENT